MGANNIWMVFLKGQLKSNLHIFPLGCSTIYYKSVPSLNLYFTSQCFINKIFIFENNFLNKL